MASISGGYAHSLAVTVDGTAWAWGSNAFGQLAISSSASGLTPSPVLGISGVSAIAGAFWHSLAIASGSVYWWGTIERNGGTYAATRASTPTLVPLPNSAVAVAGSEGFSIALLVDGTVWAWGYNNNGELGNGTLTDSLTPVQVTGLSGIVGIAAGGQFGEHALAVDTNGNVWGWGSNAAGQVGDGTTTNRAAPVRVVGVGGSTALTGIVAVAAGSGHSLALDNLGNVWAWGSNGNGDLGNTTVSLSGGSLTPVEVMGVGGKGTLANIKSIAAGDSHSMALKADGTVWGWGSEQYGQLGNGVIGSSSYVPYTQTPTQVSGSGGSGVLTQVAQANTCPPAPSGATVPGTISQVTATPGDGRATVTWTPVSSNGGAPITGYVVTASPGNATWLFGPSATSGVVPGLTSDCKTMYTFTVVARNVVGIGAQSAVSNSVLPSGHPPNPPSRVVILIQGLGSSLASNDVYDPLKVNYCNLRNPDKTDPTDLVNTSAYFDLQSPLLTAPSVDMTDALASTNAVILPYSYNGASFAGPQGDAGFFQAYPYTKTDAGTVLPDLAAAFLNTEIHSVNRIWPTANIVVVGHSEGGLVAETYFHSHFPTTDSVRAIYSLDGPINGFLKPALLEAPLLGSLYKGPYQQFLAAVPLTPQLANKYFALWNAGSTSDPALLSQDANYSNLFVPIGTKADIVYDGIDDYLQDEISAKDGLNSQLLFNPFPSSNPQSSLTGPDIQTPGQPPDLYTAIYGDSSGHSDPLVSHGYVMEQQSVINQIAGTVSASAPPSARALRSSAFAGPAIGTGSIGAAGTALPQGQVTTFVSAAGQAVVINGSGFGTSVGTVDFGSNNGVRALGTRLKWSDTQITATLPTNASTGPIHVTTVGGLSTDVGGLTVLGAKNSVSSITTSVSGSPINGQQATITATALDSKGHPLAAVPMSLSDGYGTETIQTNSSGQATYTFPGYQGETLWAFSGATSTSFALTWQAPPVMNLGLTAAPTAPTAGQAVTVSATVTNGSGSPVANQVVKFELNGPTSSSLGSSQATTNAAGVATTTVSNTLASQAGITAVTDYDSVTQTLAINWLPSVTGVTPSAGPTSGGTQVTIAGNGFVAGMAVQFGTVAATAVNVVNATTITATSPAGSSGSVDVTVVSTAGASPTSPADVFTYDPPPTVSAVSPNAGPTAGGTSVTISGSNFVQGSTVSFGGQLASNVSVGSATSITATTPAGATGVVDVTVTTPGGQSTTSQADQFAYGPPSVTSISPSSGPQGGGTSVTVTGAGFVPGASVEFGSQAGTTVVVNSPSSLTVTSPSGTGTVDVIVTTPAGSSTPNAGDTFVYQ